MIPAGSTAGPVSVLTEASVIMEEINRSGGNAGACTDRCTTWDTLLRHGSGRAKAPLSAQDRERRSLRLQSMGVTEPSTGTDTTKIKTLAVQKGERYVSTGRRSGSRACSTSIS
jgi:acyl-CoA dehydrogenase